MANIAKRMRKKEGTSVWDVSSVAIWKRIDG